MRIKRLLVAGLITVLATTVASAARTAEEGSDQNTLQPYSRAAAFQMAYNANIMDRDRIKVVAADGDTTEFPTSHPASGSTPLRKCASAQDCSVYTAPQTGLRFPGPPESKGNVWMRIRDNYDGRGGRQLTVSVYDGDDWYDCIERVGPKASFTGTPSLVIKNREGDDEEIFTGANALAYAGQMRQRMDWLVDDELGWRN